MLINARCLRLLVLILGVLPAACRNAPTEARQAEARVPPTAWQMPADVGGAGADADWLRFGWDSFVAVNWPADNQWPAPGGGGKPDKSMTIGDPRAAGRPSVWQTYLAPGQVFRSGGTDPGDWNAPVAPFTMTPDPERPGTPLPVLGGFGEKSLYFLTQNPDIGLMLFDLATTPNPVVDQNGNYVLIEVRLNQSEFEYFRSSHYYDTCAQVRDTGAGQFRYLPTTGASSLPDWARQGAVEIKTSWRILDKSRDIASRYFTTRATYLLPNGKVSAPVTLGLVGMHVLRNTPSSKSTWAWATFEQVDNVRIAATPAPARPDGTPLTPSFNPGPAGAEPAYTFGFDTAGRFDYTLLGNSAAHYNPVTSPAMISTGDVLPRTPADRPVNLSRVAPIRAAVKAINAEYQAKLQGTVWQYYELIDALYATTGGISEVKKPDNTSWNPKLWTNTPAMVNTTMESYLAYKFSTWTLDNCQSCHYDATPQVAKTVTSAPQVFSYLYRRATPSAPVSPGGTCSSPRR
jgi:hypothetical protein